MAIETIVKCDVCGALKGSTNHWYLARAVNRDGYETLQIASFDIELARNWSILCGEACIHKFVAQNLSLLAEGGASRNAGVRPSGFADTESDHYKEIGL